MKLQSRSPQSSRNSSVELLRIFAMFGVILLHYNNSTIGGGLRYAVGFNRNILVCLESVFICAVDLYILISGYYSSASSKRKFLRPLTLILQVCVFNALRFFLRNGSDFRLIALCNCILPNNYFVALYVTLYLISPYLNLLFDSLSTARSHIFVIMLLAMFSVWPTLLDLCGETTGRWYTGMSTINAFDSQRGYTIVNFVLMYVLGAWIRRNEQQLQQIPLFAIFLIFTALVAILSIWGKFYPKSAWAYHNPLVILAACAALLFFLRLQFSSKLINILAKGTFTCFLFHDYFLQFANIPQAVTAGWLYMLVHILLCCVCIYLICFAAYLLWELLTRRLFRIVEKPLSRLDGFISLD